MKRQTFHLREWKQQTTTFSLTTCWNIPAFLHILKKAKNAAAELSASNTRCTCRSADEDEVCTGKYMSSSCCTTMPVLGLFYQTQTLKLFTPDLCAHWQHCEQQEVRFAHTKFMTMKDRLRISRKGPWTIWQRVVHFDWDLNDYEWSPHWSQGLKNKSVVVYTESSDLIHWRCLSVWGQTVFEVQTWVQKYLESESDSRRKFSKR